MPALGNALVLIHIIVERLPGMRDASASRSAGILPALANEDGKGGTLAALLSHPIGRWARRPPSLTRRLRGISEIRYTRSGVARRTRRSLMVWVVMVRCGWCSSGHGCLN